MPKPETIRFSGEVVAVKGRIRLIRSFDQVSHQYQGYTLVLRGDEEPETGRRIAIGPGAHAKHQFRIGDRISGNAHRVPDPNTEGAEFYRVSGLRLERRGPEAQQRPPDPEGGIAVPLEVYRANGHRRLDAKTCAEQCVRCPWGLTMATEIILDQWNPSKTKWRFETHCYGPRGCPRYKAGPPRRVPGRKPGMVWIDDDVEREEGNAGWLSSHADRGTVLPLRQKPKDEEAPITLPTVVGVEEQQRRQPLENTPAAMDPTHVR